jgi:DNA-binding CsgD family transcriptional regulator
MENLLSRSEFEIAERIALGESKKEVAYKTHRSIYTVETTVKNIYEKLGFSKLSDLVLWYCGHTFNISFQISERKRQVFATLILLLIVVDLSINPNEFCRIRRGRSRRKAETELYENE